MPAIVTALIPEHQVVKCLESTSGLSKPTISVMTSLEILCACVCYAADSGAHGLAASSSAHHSLSEPSPLHSPCSHPHLHPCMPNSWTVAAIPSHLT